MLWLVPRQDRGDTEFTRFALEWYKRNSSPALPDFAKLHLVKALWLLCGSKDVADRAFVVLR